jgi:hypothetical protein
VVGATADDSREPGALVAWFLGAKWTDVQFVAGDTNTTKLKIAAILEFLVIVTNIATAVVIYPPVRRQSETVSLGYLAARIMESTIIAIGLMSIISVVSVVDGLSTAGGATTPALVAQANSLAHTYEWAFLFGPGLVVGVRGTVSCWST